MEAWSKSGHDHAQIPPPLERQVFWSNFKIIFHANRTTEILGGSFVIRLDRRHTQLLVRQTTLRPKSSYGVATHSYVIGGVSA